MPLTDWLDAIHAQSGGRRTEGPAPIPVCVLDDFLRPDRLKMLQGVLDCETQWVDHYSLHETGQVSREVWTAAADEKRFYQYAVLGDVAKDDLEGVGRRLPLLMLRNFLSSADFRAFLSGLTGVQPGERLDWGAVHRMEQGHYLRPHNDAIRRRNLCGVIYLGRDWQPAFGGEFVIERDGERACYAPLPNRLLLFDPTIRHSHHVAPLTPACGGWKRLSLSVWWCHPEPAPAAAVSASTVNQK